MSRYGKSYKQWFKEVECAIQKLGFSEQYANAQTVCVRSLYVNKHSFELPEDTAEYALRNVKKYINKTSLRAERIKKWQQNVMCAAK